MKNTAPSPSTTSEFGLREAGESILNAYAIIYFARSPALGAVLLTATFLSPTLGLFGLAGVLTAFAAARLIGFNRASTRSGELLYNSLLVSLGLAHLTLSHPLSPGLLAVLLPAASLAALFVSVALGQMTRQLFALPALSLPFVGLTLLLYLFFYSFTGTPVVNAAAPVLINDPPFLPAPIVYFFQSLGATFFLPNVVVGLVAFVALLRYSPLTVLCAGIGFASGDAFVHLTGLSAGAFGAGWLGTNFIFCGIALGGIYFIPGRASLILAAFGPILCCLIAVAMRAFLRPYNIPPLSLPFVLVVLCTVYALRRREEIRGLFENPYFEQTPEESFRLFHTARERFPDSLLPSLFLPFSGERVVTQGFNGGITHKDLWSHALDFESLNETGEALPPQRTTLHDTYTFGTPILSPCDGAVLQVVNHIPDNPLGEENHLENWGNLTVIASDQGGYVTLSHFKQWGVVVHEGQRVARGQLLGHCGNSGRSPLPHLHLQVQSGVLPISATVPFRVRHYVARENGSKPIFHVLGVPSEGMRIAPLEVDHQLAACFHATHSTRVLYRLERDGKAIGRETIETRLISWGQFVHRSIERGSTLRASTSEGIHIVTGWDGNADSILGYFWLGLGVVPFSLDRAIRWNDRFDPRPFRSSAFGWTADFLDLFGGVRFVELSRRFDRASENGCVTISTDISVRGSSRIPARIEATLSPTAGLIELRITKADGVIRVVQEQRETLSEA
jgi:urea transporter/murein DD-endopeptidase MepM/ murein hydrolase activator NlpD